MFSYWDLLLFKWFSYGTYLHNLTFIFWTFMNCAQFSQTTRNILFNFSIHNFVSDAFSLKSYENLSFLTSFGLMIAVSWKISLQWEDSNLNINSTISYQVLHDQMISALTGDLYILVKKKCLLVSVFFPTINK